MNLGASIAVHHAHVVRRLAVQKTKPGIFYTRLGFSYAFSSRQISIASHSLFLRAGSTVRIEFSSNIRFPSVDSFASPRFFSSTPTSQEEKNDDEILFYTSSKSRSTFARAVLGITTLHTGYWAWYVADFIPAINSAPIDSVHVSPWIGYVGLTLALTMSFFAVRYPLSLVSKMSLDGQSGMVKVWVHKLPWATPAEQPMEFPLGVVFLDPTDDETKNILHQYDGHVELFRGNLAVYAKGRRSPLLLVIREDGEVITNPEIFTEAMLTPELLTVKKGKRQQKKKGGRRRNKPERR